MQQKKKIRLIESPRDAMQGLKQFIPTQKKVEYINALLKVGYDIIDLGSFVSPKAIPQMRDTAEVIEKLDLSDTKSELLVVIGNLRGMKEACQTPEIKFFGYPFSISNTFLELNINSNIEKSMNTIDELLDICDRKDSKLMLYMSMAFGNPYGDPWSIDLIEEYVEKLKMKGVYEINFSDTIGAGTPQSIGEIFKRIPKNYPDIKFGLHLHTKPGNWYEKVDAAFKNGCDSFDSVLNGLGGCPMTQHEMVGNLNTIDLFDYFRKNNINIDIDFNAFQKAMLKAMETFNS